MCSHLFQYIKLGNSLRHRKPEITRFYIYENATYCWPHTHGTQYISNTKWRVLYRFLCTIILSHQPTTTISDRINWGHGTLESCSYEIHIKEETSLITLKSLLFPNDINGYTAYAKYWLRHFISINYGIWRCQHFEAGKVLKQNENSGKFVSTKVERFDDFALVAVQHLSVIFNAMGKSSKIRFTLFYMFGVLLSLDGGFCWWSRTLWISNCYDASET